MIDEKDMAEINTSARRLAEQVHEGHMKMNPFRRDRMMMVRQFHGPYYARGTSAVEQSGGAVGLGNSDPLNMIAYSVRTLLANLAYQRVVKCSISSVHPQNEFYGLAHQEAWNQLAIEIDLGLTLAQALTDSLFSVGIVKVGLAEQTGPYPLDPQGWDRDPNQPFVDCVDLDDYVIDPTARHRKTLRWEGNNFRVPRKWALECGLYDKVDIERLGSIATQIGRPRVENESNSQPRYSMNEDMIELCELWLPFEGVMVTLPADVDATTDYLRERQWDDNERGPYEMLGYLWPPNNVMPVSPVALIYDLHSAINRAARKQFRQADRAKTLLLHDNRTDETEKEAIRGASDGDMVGVQSVDRFKEVKFGGAEPAGYENLRFLLDQYNRMGGNPDLMSGTKAQSGTLGQDQMLMQAAGVDIGMMRGAVSDFASAIGRRLFNYLHSDPFMTRPVNVSKSGVTIPATYEPRRYPGKAKEYEFRVDLYSTPPRTAESMARARLQAIDVTLRAAPLLAAQGIAVDIGQLLVGLYQNVDIPNAESLVKAMPRQVLPQPPGMSGQPSEGQRVLPGPRPQTQPEPIQQTEEAVA